MQLIGLEGLDEHLARLRSDPDEALALGDLLITVSSFVRDPEVWKRRSDEVIPALFEGRGQHDEIRVWSVGVRHRRGGLLAGHAAPGGGERHTEVPRLQVSASDLHERSFERAREGFSRETSLRRGSSRPHRRGPVVLCSRATGNPSTCERRSTPEPWVTSSRATRT
jgi:chemotaxis methyl-accepting protein methylase